MTAPKLHLNCLKALRQGDLAGFPGYLRADIKMWLRNLAAWWRTL